MCIRDRHLLVKKSIPLDEIKEVLSHPQALFQCREFIKRKLPLARLKEVSSTAEAAKFVSESEGDVYKRQEMQRGGQIYYVSNRIIGIDHLAFELKKLVPSARIAITHGRLEGRKIEKLMEDFINKKYDILLTTSIIESGMDIINVNTLIVENAQRFGLSQLYQLRGRVGRSSESCLLYTSRCV